MDITNSKQVALVDAARDLKPVAGLTHNFYRYPARFSPTFVRETIRQFTEPGDLIFDPYMGGGTSLVEALALGRNSIGVDISSLATFVSAAKTSVLGELDTRKLESWIDELPGVVNMKQPSTRSTDYADGGYYRHLDDTSRWRIRKGIEQALSSALALGEPKLEQFARCVVLRTAQWALDGRKTTPEISQFRARLVAHASDMLAGAQKLQVASATAPTKATAYCINRPISGIEEEGLFRHLGTPKLVVTSPPYPGVHVLYHRWQIGGGKEAPAPFWIAGQLDGAGSSYYTMGDRQAAELHTYFSNLEINMKSVAAVCDENTTIVQIVAFSELSWQLPRYLDILAKLGLVEIKLPLLRDEPDGRLWRSVPNRRWYSDQRGATPGSQEVVLFHRKPTTKVMPLRQPGHSDQAPSRPGH